MNFQSFDAQYVQRLKDGDTAVENHFAGYFGELLYLKLRTQVRSRHLIEDIRQETLMRVLVILRNKGGVDHPERFGAFVNAVSRNVAYEFCRSDSRTDPMDEHQEDSRDTTVDLDAPLLNQDVQRQIERVLAEMPKKDGQLLRALFLEEVDKAEICRRYQVDQDYLRVLVHRAKDRFRKVYRGQVGNLPLGPN